MAETLTDTLGGSLQTTLTINRVDAQEVGAITTAAVVSGQYAITDGDGPGEADLAFTDTRTIPAGSVEELDLLTLSQSTLGVEVPYHFRQLRIVRIVNNETAAGRRLLVGVDPGRPTSVYAAEIGPASEWVAVNHADSWRVTSANSVVRLANPSAAPLSYSIYLVGTSVAAAGGSGGSG
jgi:hypothetical protein